MTAASRYRGQPVSDGTGVGEVYLGDARGAAGGAAAGAGADEVRMAFAAVAHDRAELARQLRSRGRDRRRSSSSASTRARGPTTTSACSPPRRATPTCT